MHAWLDGIIGLFDFVAVNPRLRVFINCVLRLTLEQMSNVSTLDCNKAGFFASCILSRDLIYYNIPINLETECPRPKKRITGADCSIKTKKQTKNGRDGRGPFSPSEDEPTQMALGPREG